MLRVYGTVYLKAAETVEMFNTKLKTFLFSTLVKVFVSVLFILLYIYFDFHCIILLYLIFTLYLFFSTLYDRWVSNV